MKQKRSKQQKILCTTLKCFIKQGAMLLNFMMIILQWLVSKAKLKATKGTGLKILTSKQML